MGASLRCVDCETIDDLVFETTHMWLHVPTGEAVAKLLTLCARRALNVERVSERCLALALRREEIEGFATALMGALTGQELVHIRLLTAPVPSMSAADMGRLVSADVFINRVKGQWIIESIQSQTFQTWFQPIVHAADPARTFGAEALFRLRDAAGNLIPPGYVFRVAEAADLLFSVDLVARANAVETAAKAGFRDKIFINFNPSSVYDPSYCLRTTASVVAELGLDTSDIVFEITETERIADIDHLKGILTFYRRAGFQVALDDIGSGWSGLNTLHTFNPDYVKIDMELVRDVHRDSFKRSIVRHLVSIAKEQDIKVIGEGIEAAAEAETLREMGVDYLQGYHFARPAPLTGATSDAAA